ncbi:MAG: hypothetical protein V4576_00150 [Patescibacteria group bacterium]
MKHTFTLKKNITGFKPELHWQIILVTSFVLFLCAIAYNGYLYVYAKKQVDLADNAVSATTPVKLSSFASPEQIQDSFKVYEDRGAKYTEIMNGLSRANVVQAAAVVATTSTSTVIATTTNQ